MINVHVDHHYEDITNDTEEEKRTRTIIQTTISRFDGVQNSFANSGYCITN